MSITNFEENLEGSYDTRRNVAGKEMNGRLFRNFRTIISFNRAISPTFIYMHNVHIVVV